VFKLKTNRGVPMRDGKRGNQTTEAVTVPAESQDSKCGGVEGLICGIICALGLGASGLYPLVFLGKAAYDIYNVEGIRKKLTTAGCYALNAGFSGATGYYCGNSINSLTVDLITLKSTVAKLITGSVTASIASVGLYAIIRSCDNSDRVAPLPEQKASV
jgi:hypothetical protein